LRSRGRPDVSKNAARFSKNGGTDRRLDRRSDEGVAPEPLSLQSVIGNRAVARMFSKPTTNAGISTSSQRVAAPSVSMPIASSGNGASSKTATSLGPGADASAEPQFKIADQAGNPRMVDVAGFLQERSRMERGIRYVQGEVTAEVKRVLPEYPYPEVHEIYHDAQEQLSAAASYYVNNELFEARKMLKRATNTWTNAERRAGQLFNEESVFSYVGKRLGLATIGFFEGAANSVLGVLDSGANLVGYDLGAVKWNSQQYNTIKTGAGSLLNIDHRYTSADEIGKVGGQISGSLATGKALGPGKGAFGVSAGTAGTVINTVTAAGDLVAAGKNIAKLRDEGREWGDILTDPAVIAQVAASLSSASGAIGGFKQAKNVKAALDQIGLALDATQITALSGVILQVEMDTTLSGPEKAAKQLEALTAILGTVAKKVNALNESTKQSALEVDGASTSAQPGDGVSANSKTQPTLGDETSGGKSAVDNPEPNSSSSVADDGPNPFSAEEPTRVDLDPYSDPEATRVYTADEVAELRTIDRQLGIQQAVDTVVEKHGASLDNFANLSKQQRFVIAESLNNELHKNFSVDRGAGRTEPPDITFLAQPDPGIRGYAGSDDIAVNSEHPQNSSFSGDGETGLGANVSHEFGHTNQQRQAKQRQAKQPEGFIDPAFGREMKKNLDNYKRTGVNASFEEYRKQPLEVDAQTWAKDFNEAVRFSKLAFLLTPEDGPDTSE
jgi:hypothetical protein